MAVTREAVPVVSNTSAPRENRTFAIVFCGLIFVHVALIWSIRLYPFTDLPNHLAVATIYKFHGLAGNRFAEYYAPSVLFKPNSFHAVFCALRVFPSVEFGNRVFFSLYAVMLPLSAWLAIRSLGGCRWFALLSFLMLFNYDLMWGFVGFTFGIPLVLLLLAAEVEFFERRTLRSFICMMLLIPSAFFVHALVSVFCLFHLCVAGVIAYRRSFARLGETVAAVVPGIGLLLHWWMTRTGRARSGKAFLAYYPGHWIDSIPDRLAMLSLNSKHLFQGQIGWRIGVAFIGVILFPLIAACIRPVEDNRRRVFAISLVISSLACCLLLPNTAFGNWCLYERFWVFFTLSLVVIGSTLYGRGIPRWGAAGICLAVLISFGLHVDYFREFEARTRDFTPAIFSANEAKDGITLSGLIYDADFRGRPVLIHYQNYYITWTRGIATSKILNYEFNMIEKRGKGRSLPNYDEWAGTGSGFPTGYDKVDLLLVHGKAPKRISELRRHFRLTRSSGEWSIWQNRRLN